ncbi:hypothetical protein Tco_1489500 [Tanacetum coccineum]
MLPTIVAQVGDQIRNQGIYGSQDDNAVGDNIHEDARNVNMSNGRSRDREAAVGMTWEDFKELMKEEYYPSNEIQKLETEFRSHAMVGVGHAALVAAMKPPTIQNVILKAKVLTDEAVRNGSLKKSYVKRGYGGKLSKEGNFKGDNKRIRTGKGGAQDVDSTECQKLDSNS